jgi:hypothetical protein
MADPGHNPSFPALESVLLRNEIGWGRNTTNYLNFPDTLPLAPGIATWLSQRPRLHSLYFTDVIDVKSVSVFAAVDKAEKRGPNGTVSSFRHGEAELLVLKLQLQEVEVEKENYNTGRYREDRRVLVNLDKPYRVVWSEPEWQAFASFEGVALPADIMAKVKAVDSSLDYEKRGVEVSEEAWQILVDWRAAQPEPEVVEPGKKKQKGKG